MDETMKKCPFCGENPVLAHDMPLRGCVTVCCINSACRIKPRTTENSLGEALKAWNIRAEKGIEKNMTAKIVEEKLKFRECKNCEDWTGCITDCVNTCGKPLDALEGFNAYKALEEQGKLLKLPCAVGNKVYLPNKYVGKVIDFEIIEICIFKEGIMFIDDSENEYFIDDFGKTVFPTREEAEAALKELEEKHAESSE